MASDCVEPTIAPDYHRARIRLLIAAHVAATLAAVVMQIFGFLPHLGLGGVLEFAQISLVSIWLAIGSGKCSRRWLKSFACFVAIVLAANGPRSMALFSGMLRYNFMAQFVLLELTMAASAWLASAAVVAAAKKWWPKFDLVRIEPNAPAPPVQFSIRSLLLLLLVTAIILTIARGVRANFAESDGSVLTFYWLTPMVAIYSGVATVACLFAGLGNSNLWLRTTVAVAVQLSLSLLMASTITQLESARVVLQATLQLAETFIILGSLWVVRSCGYRIVSRSAANAAAAEISFAPLPHPLD